MSYQVRDRVELKWPLPHRGLKKGIRGRVEKTGQVKEQGVMQPFCVVSFDIGITTVVHDQWLHKVE